MDLHEPIGEHQEATVSLKVILLIFVVVLIGALSYFVWAQGQNLAGTNEVATTVTEKTDDADVAQDPCDFDSATVTLKQGVTYDLGGGEEFDTLVCGYLTQKEENMAFDGDAPLIKNRAYFNVTKFADPKFKAALDTQISEGNTVNSVSSGVYQLGCGCYESSKIVSDTGNLTDPTSQVKLLASTADKPVMVKLSFYKEGGRGCTCCNLLDKLEVI